MSHIGKQNLEQLSQALIILVLGFHGVIALLVNDRGLWQIGLVGLVLLGGSLSLFYRRALPPLPSFGFLLVTSWLLMLSTGGAASFFSAWLFVLALYYPFLLKPLFARWVPLGVSLVYLLSIPFASEAVPTAIAFSRALLLVVIGYSIYVVTLHLRATQEEMRQKAEVAQEKEQELLEFIDASPDGITLVDKDFRFLAVNKAYADLVGYSQTELLTMSPLDFIGEDKAAEIRSVVPSLQASQTIKEEIHFKRRDGQEIIVEAHLRRLPSDRIQSIVRDVTERKKLEEALRESLEVKQLQLDTSFDGYILADAEGVIQNVNASYCNIIGYDAHELIGMNIRQLERKLSDEEVTLRIQQMTQEGSANFETQHRHKEGHAVDLDVSISVMNYKSGPLVAAFVRDITKKKVREKTLRYQAKLLEQLQDALIVCDPEFRIIQWNKGATAIYGYKEEEVLGKTVREILKTAFETEQRQESLKTLYETGKWQGEVKQFTKSGKELTISALIALTYDENGHISGVIGINRDFSELASARSQLKDSHTFLQQVVDTIPHNIFVKNKGGYFIFANETFARFYNFSSTSIVGKHERELTHSGNNADLFLELDKEVLDKETTVLNQDVKHHNPATNTVKWFQTTKTPLKNVDGTIKGVLTISTDVTARKTAEQALRLSEEKFQKAFKASPQAVVINRLSDGLYLDANDAFLRTLGYTREEVIGKTSTEIGLWQNPKQREIFQELLAKGGRVTNHEVTFVKKSGEIGIAQNSIEPIVIDGEVCIVSVGNDITAQKQAENRFRKIFEVTPSAIVILRVSDETYTAVNDSFLKVTGYTREDVIGKRPEDLGISLSPEESELYFAQLEKQGSIRNLEIILRTKTGQKVEGLLSAEIVEFEGELHRLAAFNDITEIKEAQQKLAKSEERFRKTFEASPNPSVILRQRNLRIVEVNQAFLALFKLAYNEVINKTFREISLAFNSGEGEAYSHLLRKQGYFRNFETTVHARKGEKVEGLLSSEPLTLGGEESHLLVFNDISAYKEAQRQLLLSERRFDTSFANAPIANMIIRINDWRVLEVNESYTHMTGFTSNDVVGKTADNLNVFENPADLALLQKRVLDGENVLNEELSYYRKDGSKGHILASFQTLEFGGESCVLAVAVDISERKEVEQALKQMSRQMVIVQEEERRAIARELHDEIGQTLTALKAGLKTKDAGANALEPELNLVDQLLNQVRGLSLNLHPSLLEDLGLEAALRHLYIGQTQQSNLALDFSVHLEPDSLSKEVEITLYRIAQEALTNIVRHANAKNVVFTLTTHQESVELSIADDGQGFDIKDQSIGSLGLITMQERALLLGDTFKVESMPGKGTLLRARFPKREVSV